MAGLRLCAAVLLLLAAAAAAGEPSPRRIKRIVGGAPAEAPPRFIRSSSTTPAPQTSTTAPPMSTTPPPSQAPPTSSEPTVFVPQNRRIAVVDGIQNQDGTYSFLGLRYAEPPIKRLRFQRPRKMKLRGEVSARQYGPPCPQWFNGRLIGSEDCLFLNIYTPEVAVEGRPPPSHPVIVWIHGGNFQRGSASQYLPRDIVRRGVIVVTIQYRLGSLGFLSTGRKDLPGNVGLFDQATAFRWVKDYIKYFGGDPNRIVAAGQGSGASCASFLTFNNVGRSNVKGVVAMSGTPVSPFTLDEGENRTANEVAQLDGCNAKEGLKFVRCMQGLPLETIMKGDSGVENNRRERFDYSKELSNLLTPGPAEEGPDDSRFLTNYMPESPLEAMKKGKFPNIPLLTGVTKDETGGGVKGNFLDEITKLLSPSFLQGGLLKDCLQASTGLYVNKTVNPSLSKLFDAGSYLQFFTTVVSTALNELDQVIQHMTDAFFNLPAFITSNLWSQKSKVYLYSFEHKSKSHANEFLSGLPLVPTGQTDEPSCNHGDDLTYIFELQSIEGKSTGNSSELSDADKKVKDHFTTMLAEFAKSGVPKTAGGDTWEPFSKESGNYMILDEAPRLAKGFRKCSMALWTGDTNVLNSADCGLQAASKIVTDTLGAAGTQLLNTVSSIEGRLGSTVNGVSSGLSQAGQKATDTLSNPTGALGVLKPGGSNSGLGGVLSGGNKKKENQNSGGSGLGGVLGGNKRKENQNSGGGGGGFLGIG